MTFKKEQKVTVIGINYLSPHRLAYGGWGYEQPVVNQNRITSNLPHSYFHQLTMSLKSCDVVIRSFIFWICHHHHVPRMRTCNVSPWLICLWMAASIVIQMKIILVSMCAIIYSPFGSILPGKRKFRKNRFYHFNY